MTSVRLVVAALAVAFVAITVGFFLLLTPTERPEEVALQEEEEKPEEEVVRPPEEKITLVVLTRHDLTIQTKTKELFLKSDIAKQYNIEDIRFIPAAGPLWVSFIEKGGIDVGWGGGPTLFDSLVKKGMLAPIDDPLLLNVLNKIPDDIRGVPMKRFDEGRNVLWVAAAISTFGFTINKDVLDQWEIPKPLKWDDLASEELGKTLPVPQLSIADPLRSTSNTRIYQIILQAKGWEEGWRVLTLMAANAKVMDASDAVREAVIVGDVAVGITIDFYGFIAMSRNPSTEYVIPEGQTIINGDPIAMIKGAPNPEAAQAFIRWVLTEGQKVWLDRRINRMPINPDVFETPEGKEREDLSKLYEVTLGTKGIEFDDERALATERAMQNYFRAVLIDANSELKQAWMAVLAIKEKDPMKFEELKARLTELVEFVDPITGKKVRFTEDYAREINDRLLDPEFLSQIMSAWREAARAKYLQIVEEAKMVG